MGRLVSGQRLASLEDVFQSQLEYLQSQKKKGGGVEEQEDKTGFHYFKESKSLTSFTFVLHCLLGKLENEKIERKKMFHFKLLKNI